MVGMSKITGLMVWTREKKNSAYRNFWYGTRGQQIHRRSLPRALYEALLSLVIFIITIAFILFVLSSSAGPWSAE